MDFMHFKPSSDRLAEALERARRHWQRRRDDLAVVESKSPPPFTIAVSCEAGANGPAVARALGERLHWHVYDHELVEMIAREMNVRVDLLRSLDERRTSWLEELLQSFIVGVDLNTSAYAHHLAGTLLSLAAHGECIVVGHGAAQILPAETTLRLRLVGPLQQRIAAIQRRFGCSAEGATRWVEQTDRERRAFVKEHFYKDPAAPEHYDLLLNAFRLDAPQCAEVTMSVLHMLQKPIEISKDASP